MASAVRNRQCKKNEGCWKKPDENNNIPPGRVEKTSFYKLRKIIKDVVQNPFFLSFLYEKEEGKYKSMKGCEMLLKWKELNERDEFLW